jgi:predicted GIY-YIG superfamily endonuclease
MKNEMNGRDRMHLEQKLTWRRNFSDEQHGTHFWPQKEMKKFSKSWKQNQLTKNQDDTNEIGYM